MKSNLGPEERLEQLETPPAPQPGIDKATEGIGALMRIPLESIRLPEPSSETIDSLAARVIDGRSDIRLGE
ncbi:hypothetical protein BLA39750_01108 [Burkholderia lata]|uniref:Uncharacterized protein n=1 Tax=Burkholderia lata (strain ATCC 17760 / DSM 23089 / LMG 22485 / NCIMB 9086 / R18194 / 383) TaxID=482957 RepID=A0A6P2URF8_BURL3|nr:hypothetical protein [Burkholderia lata]VWC79777.1 hypothetical protein BLA39750_01108 [Burkholderia lata]